MTRPPLTAADMIRELIDHVTTHEVIHRPQQGDDGVWRPSKTIHTVRHPALLDQIDQTMTGRTLGQETYAAAYGSKPAGRIDCLDLLRRVDTQSRDIADEHGIPLLPVRDRLSRIAGALGTDDHARVRSWWLTARVLTQHDGPPYAPNVPCPNEACERRATLRMRLDQHIAVCVECHRTWDEINPDPTRSFGRLKTWVIWAAEHLQGPRHWVTDDEGELKECTACLAERDAMTERAVARTRAAQGKPPAPDPEPEQRHADAAS